MNGRHNPVLGSAAADVPFEFAPDLCFGRRWISPQKRGALHDHPWCTVAALHGVTIDKGLLKRMQPLSVRQTLNRGNLFSGYGTHWSEA